MSETSNTKLSKKSGLPPGSLVHIGKSRSEKIDISLLKYNSETAEFHNCADIMELNSLVDKNYMNWININGIHEIESIEQIGKEFNIHPLVLEDIVNAEQRPKFEDYDDYFFVTLKASGSISVKNIMDVQQISFIVGKNYLISFHENKNELFQKNIERILNGKSKARKNGCDFLAYLLIDTVVDNYYFALEEIEDKIEILEEKILKDTTGKTLQEIQKMKRLLVMLLKAVFPLREAVSKLERKESELIQDSSAIFFRDIYDHIIHIIESVESQRDILSGLMDVYMSNTSNRMNAVMKVLAIIATIFMPITFFAGVYGMNIENIPELKWQYGYLFFWSVCIASVVLMLIYFKRRKWL
ncbi:MAG: magnesium/cobalt transporter CorA [Bacteroidetes bacterium]|nr:magnesium/cobalt transporter CorA [Bacteroidota bacterium]